MDIITPIVQALSAGAASAMQTTTSQAVKDAYEGIKTLIKEKFGHKISVEEIEKDPNSQARKLVLSEEIQHSGAENDQELFAELRKLVTLIKKEAPHNNVIGVNIEEVEAAFLKIAEVLSTGTGVNVTKSKFTGDIEVGKVTAGEPHHPK